MCYLIIIHIFITILIVVFFSLQFVYIFLGVLQKDLGSAFQLLFLFQQKELFFYISTIISLEIFILPFESIDKFITSLMIDVWKVSLSFVNYLSFAYDYLFYLHYMLLYIDSLKMDK